MSLWATVMREDDRGLAVSESLIPAYLGRITLPLLKSQRSPLFFHVCDV